MLLAGSWCWLTLATYTLITSKLLPIPQNPHLLLIATDRHFCLMPAAAVVMLIVFTFFNWLGLKYFKHN